MKSQIFLHSRLANQEMQTINGGGTVQDLKCSSVQTLLLIYQFQMIAQEKHVAVVKFRALTEKAFNVLSLIYPGICSNGAVSLNYSNPTDDTHSCRTHFFCLGPFTLRLCDVRDASFFSISPQYKNANFANFVFIVSFKINKTNEVRNLEMQPSLYSYTYIYLL